MSNFRYTTDQGFPTWMTFPWGDAGVVKGDVRSWQRAPVFTNRQKNIKLSNVVVRRVLNLIKHDNKQVMPSSQYILILC